MSERAAGVQGVILAAGRGSRLHPLTLKRSKAMIPILGKPMVARVLEQFSQCGIDDVIMVVSPDDLEIRRYFSAYDGWRTGARESGRGESRGGKDRKNSFPGNIRFVEQPERLGMANALALAAPLISGPFVLSACDNLIPVEHLDALLQAYAQGNCAGVLSLMRVEPEMVERTGIVEMVGNRICRIVEKPRLEDAPSDISSLPLYVFDRRILELLPLVEPSARGEYELQDAIQKLIGEAGPEIGAVTGVFTPERLQLTNAADLLALNLHYLATAQGVPKLSPAAVGEQTHLVAPLRIEDGTTIGPGCVIGPRVYIEGNCRIGANVHLQDVVVLRDSVIEAGSRIVGQVFAG